MDSRNVDSRISHLLGLSLVASMMHFVAGCGNPGDGTVTTVSSAVTSTQMKSIVPAYFMPDDSVSSWDRVIGGPNQGWAVVNVTNGPGTAGFEQWRADRMDQLNGAGKTVLGYVPIAHGDRPVNEVFHDIITWFFNYGSRIHGIFFDEASRDSDNTRVPIYEFFAWSAQNWFTNGPDRGTAMFNFSPAFRGRRYFDCAVQIANSWSQHNKLVTRFVTQEEKEDYYPGAENDNNWAAQTWNWVNNYSPEHFLQLVHDADPSGANVSDDVAKAKARNAHAV